ncbi:MAG: hypothetical protein Q8N37_00340 [bacterium]|nr:hypothetical protein [bacterium]
METQQMPPQNTPPVAPQAPLTDEQDIQQNKIWALLSYLGILFLIPLLAKKDSKFAQFHAKQGVILFVISFVSVIPIIGWMLSPLVIFVLFIVSVIGIINVLQGKYWKIPVIGDYAEKINI